MSHRQARAEHLNKAALWQLMFYIPLNSFPLKIPDYLCKIPQGHTVTGTVPTIQPSRLLSAALFILIQHLKNTQLYYASLGNRSLFCCSKLFGDECIHSTGRQALLTALNTALMVWSKQVCKFRSRSTTVVICIYKLCGPKP